MQPHVVDLATCRHISSGGGVANLVPVALLALHDPQLAHRRLPEVRAEVTKGHAEDAVIIVVQPVLAQPQQLGRPVVRRVAEAPRPLLPRSPKASTVTTQLNIPIERFPIERIHTLWPQGLRSLMRRSPPRSYTPWREYACPGTIPVQQSLP